MDYLHNIIVCVLLIYQYFTFQLSWLSSIPVYFSTSNWNSFTPDIGVGPKNPVSDWLYYFPCIAKLNTDSEQHQSSWTDGGGNKHELHCFTVSCGLLLPAVIQLSLQLTVVENVVQSNVPIP